MSANAFATSTFLVFLVFSSNCQAKPFEKRSISFFKTKFDRWGKGECSIYDPSFYTVTTSQQNPVLDVCTKDHELNEFGKDFTRDDVCRDIVHFSDFFCDTPAFRLKKGLRNDLIEAVTKELKLNEIYACHLATNVLPLELKALIPSFSFHMSVCLHVCGKDSPLKDVCKLQVAVACLLADKNQCELSVWEKTGPTGPTAKADPNPTGEVTKARTSPESSQPKETTSPIETPQKTTQPQVGPIVKTERNSMVLPNIDSGNVKTPDTQPPQNKGPVLPSISLLSPTVRSIQTDTVTKAVTETSLIHSKPSGNVNTTVQPKGTIKTLPSTAPTTRSDTPARKVTDTGSGQTGPKNDIAPVPSSKTWTETPEETKPSLSNSTAPPEAKSTPKPTSGNLTKNPEQEVTPSSASKSEKVEGTVSPPAQTPIQRPPQSKGDNKTNVKSKSDTNASGKKKNLTYMKQEEEDEEGSYTFFGFIVLFLAFCIFGYLGYHKKDKIVAYILEGNNERKRQQKSGGPKYSPLNVQGEEALDITDSTKSYVY